MRRRPNKICARKSYEPPRGREEVREMLSVRGSKNIGMKLNNNNNNSLNRGGWVNEGVGGPTSFARTSRKGITEIPAVVTSTK